MGEQCRRLAVHTEGKRMIHKRAGALGGAEKGRAEYGRDKKKI